MRCKYCEYELWHCTGRTCTECGESFSLADYIFESKEIRFHCPHCDLGIAGDGKNGLPKYKSNTCKSCRSVNTIEDFIVRPTQDYDHDCDGLLLPIRSVEGNIFTRYFSTVWMIMLQPKKSMGRIPSKEPISNAWKFSSLHKGF